MVELNKLYTEAKDNVKFLSTLERHFKNIITGSISSVQDTLQSLLNAVRMVWIISRHYNRDERMVPLMGRIAWELSNKVGNVVNVKTVFKIKPEEAKKKIWEAKELLEAWSKTYFQVRERIEQSGRDQRWEFDRKKLFEQTNYMAARCSDLHEIAEVMEQFYNIFGAQLKAVTGDAQQIDEVIKRVDQLIVPFETCPFDIYSKKYQSAWEGLMDRFREQIIQIEDMAKQFIDASFKKLRSAEGAFDLLQNIKNIKSRESINTQLMSKWYEILDQYAKEVDNIEELFKKHKYVHFNSFFPQQTLNRNSFYRDNPPINKNQSRVAGSISWSRSLFYRIKRTILRFRSLQELLDSEQGRVVTKKYLFVAKSMKDYETELYQEWCQTVESSSLHYLKAHVLTKATPIGFAAGPPLGQPLTADLLDPEKFDHIMVNFRPELKDLIKETKYLDLLGFSVPEVAMNIALQEDKYHNFVENLNLFIKNYHAVIDSLELVEKKLLLSHISELKRVLKPGFTRLNWNSLGIPDFNSRCTQELNKFSSVVNQIKKNSANIFHAVQTIASSMLIKEPPTNDLMDAHEFFDFINRHRINTVDSIVQKHKSVGPLLIKMESLVAGTNTGKSKILKEYYAYWEKKIWGALNYVRTLRGHIQGRPLFF